MKYALIIKQCEKYYKLNKLAGLMAFPEKMGNNIISIATKSFARDLAIILKIINNVLDVNIKILNKKYLKNKNKKILDKEQILLKRKELVVNLLNEIISEANITVAVKLLNKEVSSDVIANMNNCDDISQLYEIIQDLIIIHSYEVETDISDLPERYKLHQQGKVPKKKPFFEDILLETMIDMPEKYISLGDGGGYDPIEGRLVINYSRFIHDILYRIENLFVINYQFYKNIIKELVQHELRHFVQSFLDWKTGVRVFNSNNELCWADSKGKPILDSNGNPVVKPPANHPGYSSIRELSEASEAINFGTLSLDEVQNENAKLMIENLYRLFNLPKSTKIDAMLIQQLEKISDNPEKKLALINIKNLYKSTNPPGIGASAEYLLSGEEFHTWLADSKNIFFHQAKINGKKPSRKFFAEFVGSNGITTLTSNFFKNLYLYDKERWKNAVSTLWKEVEPMIEEE